MSASYVITGSVHWFYAILFSDNGSLVFIVWEGLPSAPHSMAILCLIFFLVVWISPDILSNIAIFVSLFEHFIA